MTTGRTTPVQMDFPDAPDGPDASTNTGQLPTTPTRPRKKRAREATSPALPRPKHSGELSKSPPSWTMSLNPTPTPEAREARELTQPNSIIRSAFEAKAKKISEAGQALTELEGYISGKVREWEEAGLTEALGLGTEINSVIRRYCENLNSNNKDSANVIYQRVTQTTMSPMLPQQ
jgi:hypothetical protein